MKELIIAVIAVFVAFLFSFLYYILFNWLPLFWFSTFFRIIVIIIIITSALVVFLIENKNRNSASSSRRQTLFSNNQVYTNQSSNIASSHNIQWTEISTNQPKISRIKKQHVYAIVDHDFLSSRSKTLDVDELLKNLIGQKDRVSSELFCQGEKIYFCVACQLGYHEESWEYLERRCEQCKSSNIGMYILPITSFREFKQTKPTESSSINENEFLRCGVEKINRGDYGAAILDFSKLLRLNPKNSYAYYNRATAHYQLGNKQAAIEDYTQALRLNPNHTDAYKNRGIAYCNLGDRQAAIDDYTQALRLNPNLADAYNNRGIAYCDLGNKQEAIDDYTQALRLNPNYADAYNNRGIAHRNLGNKQAAIDDYTQALRLDPNLADAYNNLGNVHCDLGNIQAAVDDYTQALRLNPNHADAYNNRGFVHSNLGNIQAAIDDYTQALRLNPNHTNAYYNRGVVYYELGNIQAAIDDYTQAIQINPHDADAYNNRGFAHHYNLGNTQAAIDDYTQALKINSNHTQAKTNLDIARSQLENTRREKYISDSNRTNSCQTKVSEDYISALDLDAICRNVGQTISVKGRIRNVRVEKYHNIIYFDFSENTRHGFYAYVPTSNVHNFFNPTFYSGMNVVVSGRISLNRSNQPRMSLNDTSQLKDAES